MRYASYELNGSPTYGVVVSERVVNLPLVLQGAGEIDIPPTLLGFIQAGPALWEKAGRLVASATETQTAPLSEVKLLAPIPRPAKNVFCLGLNYADHVAEGARMTGQERPLPEYPVFFTKPPTAVIGPEAPIPVDPRVSDKIDWEVELAVVIGRGGKNIPADRWEEHIFGYTILNDVSARDLQRRHGGQFFKGKALDGSCPIGPWIVTRDELGDPQNLALETRVNGVRKQHSNTKLMIFNLGQIIASLSEGLTLEPGDIIATGTPDGVGAARTPPEFLKPGDVVELEIEGIGVLRNPVARAGS